MDGDLGEALMHIKRHRPHGYLLVVDNNSGEAGQHDTYGFALGAQPDKSKGRPDISSGSTAHMRVGLPLACAPRCPCSGANYFANPDRTPSFITDLRVTVVVAAATVARPQQPQPPP